MEHLTNEQLRAMRGDNYQDRENAQAAVRSAETNISAINQELLKREQEEVNEKAVKEKAKPAK